MKPGLELGPAHELASSQPPPAASPPPPIQVTLDIEHAALGVDGDDPRAWSDRKKSLVLALVSAGAIIPTLGASIYNPSFDDLKRELGATDAELALSLSLFILFQGSCPLLWSSIAEVIGRKIVYISAYIIFIGGTVVASRAQNMPILIVFRMVQAFGSSAVLSVGAGSLADIYEPDVRGTKMGMYYAAPLIGPSLGPLLGGALTQAYSWRATFYFLACFGALGLIAFCFFPDTFRKERSLAYKKALNRSVAASLHRAERRSSGLKSGDATPALAEIEMESQDLSTRSRSWWPLGRRGSSRTRVEPQLKVRLVDINPFPPAFAILRFRVNYLAVISSGILFATQFTIAFTAAVTLAAAPYNYDPLVVGLVLLAFGVGNISGSVLGGRLSDRMLSRLKKANNGTSEPEMRLQSMYPAMPVMVLSCLGYAWACQYHAHIAIPVVCLFLLGFSIMVCYSSVLAFLVDANIGRASAAVACNSLARGLCAFLMSEVALPIRDKIGDGGLYTIFAGLLACSSATFVLLVLKGRSWRAASKVTSSSDS